MVRWHGTVSTGGFYDHLRQSFGSTDPVPCRHCKATGGCSCGQESAGLVFDAARELALPTGSAAADREAQDFRKALVAGPLPGRRSWCLRSALTSLLSGIGSPRSLARRGEGRARVVAHPRLARGRSGSPLTKRRKS